MQTTDFKSDDSWYYETTELLVTCFWKKTSFFSVSTGSLAKTVCNEICYDKIAHYFVSIAPTGFILSPLLREYKALLGSDMSLA